MTWGPSRRALGRRALLSGLAAGVALPALAAPPTVSLRPAPRPGGRGGFVPSAEGLIADADLGRAALSYVVADRRTGEVLEAHAPDLPLPPASVAKAITALYALDSLGDDFRFRTRVLATGPIRGGRLEGDLVLAGSGDPVLDTDALAELATRVTGAGVTAVTGRFLIWDGALPRIPAIDATQPETAGYNPALSGLNLNFNRVHFEWRRSGNGWSVAMDARSARHRPSVQVARMRVVDRRGPVYTYRNAGGVDEWTVAAGALGNGGSRWLPVRQPAAYTAEVFAAFARSRGLDLPAPERVSGAPAGTLLAERRSPALRPMLEGMLRYSTNITAEAIGLQASAARGPRPGGLDASAERMSAWLRGRIGREGPRLVDHSGLGVDSRISAADMVRTLVALGPEADLSPILKDIPMRDAAYRPIPDSPLSIRAKTGTLHFVSALAGYATAPDGTDLAFATFSADLERRAAIDAAEREVPRGARAWTRRARILQLRLIDRWRRAYADA